MPSEFDSRTRPGERRYPNGERMREDDIPLAEEAPDRVQSCVRSNRFIPAIVLVSVGVLFLLSNMGLFHIWDLWHYWPVILIVSGVVKMSSHEEGSKPSATVMLIVGAVFLMMNLGLFDLRIRFFWPLIFVGAGLYMFARSWNHGRWGNHEFSPQVAATWADSDSRLQNWAIFGGVKRVVNSQNFAGGELTAVFGGIEIDLRRAQIVNNGRPVIIEANAAFGGISIKVPDTWRIAVRGIGIFGGYQDEGVKLRQSDALSPLLVVTGYAAFGGVVVE